MHLKKPPSLWCAERRRWCAERRRLSVGCEPMRISNPMVMPWLQSTRYSIHWDGSVPERPGIPRTPHRHRLVRTIGNRCTAFRHEARRRHTVVPCASEPAPSSASRRPCTRKRPPHLMRRSWLPRRPLRRFRIGRMQTKSRPRRLQCSLSEETLFSKMSFRDRP